MPPPSGAESGDEAAPVVGCLVGLNTATSIPVELSKRLSETELDLDLVVYYENEFRELGIAPERTVELRGRGPWDPRPVLRLAQYLTQREPVVLHVHHRWSAFVGALVGRLLGVRVIKTEHRPHQPGRSPVRILDSLTLLLADQVVTNSRATAVSFAPWLRRRVGTRTRIIHNGVDIDAVDAATPARTRRDALRRTLPGEGVKIVTVGRLIEEKNQSTLLEALALIDADQPEPGLTVVGGGPMREALEALARSCGVSDRVRFTGWVARESVYELLHVADLFVMPSRSEGFCNAAVEAMAAGCFLICSDIPALREVVGKGGVFVAPDAPEEWAEAISAFADTPLDERTEPGSSLRQRVERNFSLRETVEAHRQLYSEILASGRA